MALERDGLAVLWASTHAAQIVFAVRAFRRDRRGDKSLAASSYGSLPALLTFVLFVAVFVIGRTSIDPQQAHASESGARLWESWFTGWAFLVPANLIALAGCALVSALPPYPPTRTDSFVSRLCAVGGCFCACYATLHWQPRT